MEYYDNQKHSISQLLPNTASNIHIVEMICMKRLDEMYYSIFHDIEQIIFMECYLKYCDNNNFESEKH